MVKLIAKLMALVIMCAGLFLLYILLILPPALSGNNMEIFMGISGALVLIAITFGNAERVWKWCIK